MNAAHDESQPALVVGDTDEHCRELSRRVLDAGTTRPHEQVRVTRARRGLAQRAERPLLSDDDRVHERRAYGTFAATAANTRAATPSGGPAASTSNQPRAAASSRYAARTRA